MAIHIPGDILANGRERALRAREGAVHIHNHRLVARAAARRQPIVAGQGKRHILSSLSPGS